MDIIRSKAGKFHALRKKLGIPLRQPLKTAYVHLSKKEIEILERYGNKPVL